MKKLLLVAFSISLLTGCSKKMIQLALIKPLDSKVEEEKDN